jgi:NAD(P)-dependent dehydrogenase (short-subunit alcohol dehydrogenase family)
MGRRIMAKQNAVALVTGANRGIGREIARELAAKGLRVVVAAREESAANVAAQNIAEEGGQVEGLVLDVSDSASIAHAAREFAERFDRLDVLINNAGIYPDKGVTILTATRELFARTLHTNTLGPIEVVQQLLPSLRKSQGARIINMSSGYGQLDDLSPDVSAYCLSKLALNGVTIMLSRALAGEGIAVNSMCPGWVRTDMGGSAAPRSVEEGADTAVWLATEADHSLTGKFFRDRAEIPW